MKKIACAHCGKDLDKKQIKELLNPKKKKKGSKKGSVFERFMSKDLSTWWSNGQRDDIFWRTAGSGARATVRRKRGNKTANSDGDLAAIDPIGNPFIDFFLVEIKKGYSSEVQILNFLDNPEMRGNNKSRPPVLIRWFDKAEKERIESGRKHSIIFFRRDSKEIMVMMGGNLYFNLCMKVTGSKNPLILPFISVSVNNKNFYFMKYNDWKNWVKPKDIINLNNDSKKPIKRVR